VEHEAAAAGHEAGSGFPPFDQIGEFGVSQIFWLIVTFAVFYILVAFVFLPKIRKAVEDRDGAIKADVAKAAELSANADASVKQFETQIAEARARARDTASKAKAEADAKTAAQTARVEADLNTRLAAAESRIAETRAKAMANVSAVAEDAAAAIAERLTGLKPTDAIIKKAVAGALTGATRG
jgi:F-type H+-transporting ATPase subunit b